MHDVTYEEYQIVEYLRGDACASCIFNNYVGECTSTDDCLLRKAADLIESLAAELEQVKRERDAAVEDLRGYCNVCMHWNRGLMEDACEHCRHSRPFDDDTFEPDNWQWRGVKEE